MMENYLVNKEILEQYKTDLESLPLWKSIKNIDESDKTSEIYCIKQTSINIGKCFEMLEQGLLITAQLEDIRINTEDYWYNEQCAKPILDLYKQFKFENYREELAHFIKQNVGWRDKERDFEIYNEHKKGKIFSEISNELDLDLTIPAISMINKRVQSSINNLKGKLFEIEYETYLRSLNKFRNSEIIRDGAPGKPDIYIIDDKDLYVLSLKNLELNKKVFTIIKDQLKPELEFAYLKNTFEEFNIVELYLIVFDSLTEKLFVREIDYKNPSNVNLYS